MLGADQGFLLRLGDTETRLTSMLAEFGLDVSPDTEIRHLALGQRQRVEIIKVLMRGTRVLLLDEPTSVLTPGEVTSLLELLRRLRDQGVAVVLITHKLGEALAVSDRVTILRGGPQRRRIRTRRDVRGQPGERPGANRRVDVRRAARRVTTPAATSSAGGQVLLALDRVSTLGDRGSARPA